MPVSERCFARGLRGRHKERVYQQIANDEWVISAPSDPEAPYEAAIPIYEMKERFIEIFAIDTDCVVCVIEILSPANKTPGTARKEYLNKQHSLLETDTHLLEIDLLRAGAWTVAAPEEAAREKIGEADYVFCLYWADTSRLQSWGRTVREVLPRKLLIPLTNGASDVLLDLQAAFDEADEAWANTLLQTIGLRPTPE